MKRKTKKQQLNAEYGYGKENVQVKAHAYVHMMIYSDLSAVILWYLQVYKYSV